MKSKEQWQREYEEILQLYEEVKRELLQIPGVVEVGVGIKEKTIAGVTREQAVMQLTDLLQRLGSESLRAALKVHRDRLEELFLSCDTVDALIQVHEDTGVARPTSA
jgi:hypothetical protein